MSLSMFRWLWLFRLWEVGQHLLWRHLWRHLLNCFISEFTSIQVTLFPHPSPSHVHRSCAQKRLSSAPLTGIHGRRNKWTAEGTLSLYQSWQNLFWSLPASYHRRSPMKEWQCNFYAKKIYTLSLSLCSPPVKRHLRPFFNTVNQQPYSRYHQTITHQIPHSDVIPFSKTTPLKLSSFRPKSYFSFSFFL